MEKYIPNIIGIGEFQKNAPELLKRLHQKEGEGLIVSHNKPQAIVMSLKRYEKLRRLEETIHREEEEVFRIIQEGDEEYRAGKTLKAKSMKAFLD